MSGGVDSSVAASRLLAAGFEVVGVTLHLWDYPDDGSVKSRCCAPEDIHDARRVADRLGFAHYAFDRRELFRRVVVEPFVNGYLEGDTPSPCVRCNRGIKLPELLHLADELGASAVATGHYARVLKNGARHELHRAVDRQKDQSYFLHTLSQRELSRLRFPLGDASKREVRDEALRLGLPGAQKGESQELCFVPSGRYDAFVTERAGERVRPGPIVDETGREIGRHEGIHGFTVGQRKNLGISLGHRAYVVAIEAESGRVRLGAEEELFASGARLEQVLLAADVTPPVECDVVVRYHGAPQRGTLVPGERGLEVHFATPVRAVVRGQFAVFYDGERVLGGGAIREAIPRSNQEAPA